MAFASAGIIAAGIGAAGSIGGGLLAKGGSGGGKVKQFDAYRPPGPRERQFQLSLQDLFGEGRQVSESGVSQLGLMTPELLRELGFDPIVEDRTPELEAAGQEVDRLRARVAKFVDRGSHQGPKSRTVGRKRREAIRDLRSAEQRLGDLRTQPYRITGIRSLAPEDIPAESYRSAKNPLRQLEALTLAGATAALRGEAPVDPTLVRELDRQELVLRERLRRQLGEGFETTTPGEQALADFAKRRTEAVATYQRERADTLSAAAFAGETTLQSLMSGRLEQNTYLPRQTITAGAALSDMAGGAGTNIGTLLMKQRERVAVSTSGGASGPSATQYATLGAAAGELGRGLYDYGKSLYSTQTNGTQGSLEAAAVGEAQANRASYSGVAG